MEFEFQRRMVTKEDKKQLIFWEILEYHPQLLRGYLNGTERTNFLYPSAIDQFRKQLAHLEENGSKSGTVIHLDRKHASLPRSTVVHNMIPPKEQSTINSFKDGRQTREEAYNENSSQATGKVVGPVLPYEKGNIIKEANDPRASIRSTMVPTQAIPPAYSYNKLRQESKEDPQ